MTTVHQEERSAIRTAMPAHGLAAVGLAGFWLVIASAETLLGDGQDALDDVGMIADNSGLISGAGLLHWLAGVLLVVALAGLAPLVWSSRLARIGWWLTVTMTTSLGAFAMVHLLAVQTAAPGLDPVAMNEFLVDRLGSGAGPWIGPMLFVGILGPVSVMILLSGVARAGLASWISPALFAAGGIIHAVLPGELVEAGSHWLMASGPVLAAHGVWCARGRTSEGAATVPERGFPHARAAAFGLGTFWVAFAIGEVLTLGGEDALDDVGMISDNYGVITMAGVAYWLSGILLVVGLVGVAPVVWRSRVGRVGLGLSALAATAMGGFSMLHLFALETAAEGLTESAMNDFLVQRVGTGSGLWILPVMTVGLFGPIALAVLLAGLARQALATWLPCGVFVVGALLRFMDIPPTLEIGLYAVMAGVLLHAAVRVGRVTSP